MVLTRFELFLQFVYFWLLPRNWKLILYTHVLVTQLFKESNFVLCFLDLLYLWFAEVFKLYYLCYNHSQMLICVHFNLFFDFKVFIFERNVFEWIIALDIQFHLEDGLKYLVETFSQTSDKINRFFQWRHWLIIP